MALSVTLADGGMVAQIVERHSAIGKYVTQRGTLRLPQGVRPYLAACSASLGCRAVAAARSA